MEGFKQLANIIANSKNIVFFGGAGVSTESNIPDFRSVDGLYNQKYPYPPEQILSHSFFMNKTLEFFEFYREKMVFLNALPNEAHIVLAKLEEQGKLKGVITQNIDNLHFAAGRKNVMELHGSIYRNYCMKCGKFYDLDYVMQCEGVPKCSCGGIVKPDVVLYEEGLNQKTVNGAIKLIEKADTLIVGGTSLNVYPAASFLDMFIGSSLVLINRDITRLDQKANLVINEKIGETFRKTAEQLLL